MGTECRQHFTINDQCLICKAPNVPPLQKGDIITIENMPELNGTYRVKKNKNGTIELEFYRGTELN